MKYLNIAVLAASVLTISAISIVHMQHLSITGIHIPEERYQGNAALHELNHAPATKVVLTLAAKG